MTRILLCTSYNKLKDGTLQLRNNWTEEYDMTKLQAWNIEPKFMEDTEGYKYQFTDRGISPIQEGIMSLDDVVIHVRIINY